MDRPIKRRVANWGDRVKVWLPETGETFLGTCEGYAPDIRKYPVRSDENGELYWVKGVQIFRSPYMGK